MADFQTLQNDVLAHHFDSTNYLQAAKDYLNDAQSRVAERLDIRAFAPSPSTITLAAGGNSGNLPADFLRVRFVENATGGSVLSPIDSFDELETANLAGTDTTRGAPAWYLIEGATIKFYPAAASGTTIKLYYYRTPVALSGNTDVPEIPTSYHRPVLVPYAVAMCFRREGDAEMAQFFMAEFERELDRMAIQLQYDGYEGPRQVAGAW